VRNRRQGAQTPCPPALGRGRKGLCRTASGTDTLALVPLLITAAILLLPVPVRAAPPAPPPARTLEEIVRATIASEESLRIAEAEVRKAELRSRRFLLNLTPDVRLQGSYLRIDAEDAGADGGSTPGDTYAWAITLNQALYTGGRATAAYRGQRDQEGSLRLQAEVTRRSLSVAAAQAFYTVLGAAEAIGIGEQAVALARLQFERAARRVQLGEAVLNDQLRAEVSLRRFESELAGFRSTLAQAREAVRRLSGLELAADLVVPAPLPQITGDDESLVAEALAARREQKQARLAVAAAEESVREKKGRFLPSLALNAAWGETGEEFSDRDWSWSAGVVLDMPIYDRGSTPYALRESRVELEQERLRAEATSRDIEREVRDLLREIEAARSVTESLRLGVAAAAENLRLSGRRYEVGLADSLEVADAQNADVVARVGLVAAGYRLEALTLRLRNALGRKLFAELGTAASLP
jgi:outer membrane protein